MMQRRWYAPCDISVISPCEIIDHAFSHLHWREVIFETGPVDGDRGNFGFPRKRKQICHRPLPEETDIFAANTTFLLISSSHLTTPKTSSHYKVQPPKKIEWRQSHFLLPDSFCVAFMDSHRWSERQQMDRQPCAGLPKLHLLDQQQPPPALSLFAPEPSGGFHKTAATPPPLSSFPRIGYFTLAQWQELELQALIYKYMLAGVSGVVSWGRCAVDSEPGRCRRTDGKKWRCSREVVIVTVGRSFESNCSNLFLQELQDSKPEGYVLQRFLDEWPRSQQESDDGLIHTSHPASTTHLSISLAGNPASDFSLKLSTGNNGEKQQRPEEGSSNGGGEEDGRVVRPGNHWSGWGHHGEEASMGGGPLAEALRSAASTQSPTSVLHKPNGSVSETSSISP
ncbi:hypothetical protein BHE74_00043753 [Ensete ventricosum]|nr:hypothetical protein BHE74_00043753 [Ensete ventricosum]